MNSTSGFQKSVKRGEKLSWCRKATPKSSIQTRPDFTKQFLEGLFPEIHTYVYSESAEEPNPEKPCPFLFSMSRRAVYYNYAEAKVFEHQNPTAARDLEVYGLALVDAACAAPGDHALQLHRCVCLFAFSTLPELSAYK